MLILLLFALGFGLTLVGCASVVQVKEGHDPIVVRAEWLLENGTSSIDSFFAWERNNEAALLKKSPQIHTRAVALRSWPGKPGPAERQITELERIKEQYKKDKSAPNANATQAATQAFLELVNSLRAEMGQPPLVLPTVNPSVTDLMKNAPTNAPPQ